MRAKADSEPLLTCRIKLRNTVELRCRTLLQNLSLKILSFSTITSAIFRRLFEFVWDIKVHTEAATRGVLYKKVFLKILQNSQENTCARASFLINFIKIPVNFVFFTEHLSLEDCFCT